MSDKTATDHLTDEIKRRVGDSDFVRDHIVVIPVSIPAPRKKGA
jgi:hypothetical protein